MIHTCGDSHSKWSFRDCKQIHPHWLGPWTMHRFGRGEFSIHSLQIPIGSDVLLSFGEIDVRCHVGKHAPKHHFGTMGVLVELASGYEKAILKDQVPCQWNQLGVMSIVPPARQLESLVNEEFPFIGSDQERASNTAILNGLLRAMCHRNGWIYVDIYSIYAAPDGTLPSSQSDGNVHIGNPMPAIAKLLCDFGHSHLE